MQFLLPFLYLLSAIAFILTLKGLASPITARRSNQIGMMGMGLAVLVTLCIPSLAHQKELLLLLFLGGGIGACIAGRISMTAIPQLIAGFHSLVGLAAVLVAFCALLSPKALGLGQNHAIHTISLLEMSIGLVIGAITFSGSLIAFVKLQGIVSGKPLRLPGHKILQLILLLLIATLIERFLFAPSTSLFLQLTLLSCLLGLLLIIPIGGADMPVVISLLNSYSGWATVGIGFTLQNHLLIITGALVGASGAILSYIMCKGMNRSMLAVLFGGRGNTASIEKMSSSLQNVRQANGEDAAFLLTNAKEVIIVPGYGMAVSRAQHAVKELVQALQKKGVHVRFAIHPVAGRMPGHMNVLLAEADIPYDLVFEQSEINRDFASCDVAFVIGANDITNPAAKKDTRSPIYGMPVLDVDKAKNVLFVKRSLAPGYAGVENTLFFQDNTYMVLGDAKVVTESIVQAIGG